MESRLVNQSTPPGWGWGWVGICLKVQLVETDIGFLELLEKWFALSYEKCKNDLTPELPFAIFFQMENKGQRMKLSQEKI